MSDILPIRQPVPLIGGELNFQPMYDFVLVEELTASQSAGGIALPEGADTGEPRKCRVVRVGPGKTTEYGAFLPVENVNPGDVFYMMFAYGQPIPVKLAGKQYVLCRARDLVGKLEAGKPSSPVAMAA